MPKTYDVGDKAQYEAYLAETAYQWLAYGGFCLSYNKDGSGGITVYDGSELEFREDGSAVIA